MGAENIEWSQTLSVGDPVVDRQHKKLFDLAASLIGDRDQLRVMRILSALSEYVVVHFRDEEKLLETIGYPERDAHRQLHDEFRSRLAKLYVNAGGMTLDQIAEEVRALINEWMTKHIMVADREYIEYLPKQESVS